MNKNVHLSDFINDLVGLKDEKTIELVSLNPEISKSLIRQLVSACLSLTEAVEPFVEKCDKWEAAHPGGIYPRRDSEQITHRLGDFRKLRSCFKSIIQKKVKQ